MRIHTFIFWVLVLAPSLLFTTVSYSEQAPPLERSVTGDPELSLPGKLPPWTILLCGNGVLNPGEACDDHNQFNGDGCSRRCIVEKGWQCIPKCDPIHGDGLVVGSEICDDGNTRDDDYCDASRNRVGDLTIIESTVVGMPLSGDAESDDLRYFFSIDNFDQSIVPDLIPTGERLASVGDNAAILEGGTVWTIAGDPPAWTIFDYAAQGFHHGCGLHPDGTMDCWGYGDERSPDCQSDMQCGQAIPRDGVYDDVAVGSFHSCAVRSTDQRIECWGYNPDTDAPEDLFDRVAITSVYGMNWGLTRDGHIVSGGGYEPWPAETFVDIAAGSFFVCGISTDQDLECWGADINFKEPGYVAVSAYTALVCGLSSQGVIRCWLFPPPPS